ncbi:efflux RND transporter periplasmic adaptor subunit [Sulfurospirillum sp. 1612]|uniref:efflux RND transporter periplasmic adaptor subunit n=1 Tax=Sulfurospirillum sp. 1612 TaxID=3094835 RepID=UPI002F928C94
MKRLKQTLLVSAASLLLIPSLTVAAPAGKMPAPKADVFVVKAPKARPITLTYPAQILPYKSVKVVSRVLGVLEKKYFIEGEHVTKGQHLYQIEDSMYQAKVDAAKASVQMSKATLQNATRKWNRVKKLYASKAISQESRDSAISAYEEALASLALSKAQLKEAQIDLDYTKVKAPISGIIGLKQVDVGDLVTSNPPQTLVTITQNDKVYTEFSMPMSDYSNIKNNTWSMPSNGKLTLQLLIDGKPYKTTGTVDFIDVNINKQSATVKLRALFDNTDGYLMPGSFARVVLSDIAEKNVIMIPQKAVLQNPLGTIVFVAEKGKVAVRPVVISNEAGNMFTVKPGTLKAGDKVIVNNFFRLKPGAAVQIDKTVDAQGK